MRPKQSFRRRGNTRRNTLRTMALSAGALSGAGLPAGALSVGFGNGWLPALANHAAHAGTIDPERSVANRVVLLWLNGGPATIDLWDLKPRHANGGPFREIMTRTPGTRISEHLPQLARWSEQMAIIRSLSSKEGDHSRAGHLTRRGYVPQAGIDFPDLGALVTNELYPPDELLPGYVCIAAPRSGFSSNGFLGPKCAPMRVGQGARSAADLVVPNLVAGPNAAVNDAESLALLERMNRQFVDRHPSEIATRYSAATQKAIAAMTPEAAGAFDLSEEPEKTRRRYGEGLFGQGCLLARRLLERDVCFVEVTLDGWDTHSDNFNRVKELSLRLDTAFSALLEDLQHRGLLSSTLVICMGEFGRTPKINPNSGRDHWPGVWSAVVAGGQLGRGQLIGESSHDGTAVETQPYAAADLIATVCRGVGIDPMKQNDSNVGRPIRIADPSAKLIDGLL